MAPQKILDVNFSSRWQRRFGKLRRVARSLLCMYLALLVLMMFLGNYLVYPIPPAARGDWVADGLGLAGICGRHTLARTVNGPGLTTNFQPQTKAALTVFLCFRCFVVADGANESCNPIEPLCVSAVGNDELPASTRFLPFSNIPVNCCFFEC